MAMMAGENIQTKTAKPRVTERMIRARAQAGRPCDSLAMDATTTAKPLTRAIKPATADGLAPIDHQPTHTHAESRSESTRTQENGRPSH